MAKEEISHREIDYELGLSLLAYVYNMADQYQCYDWGKLSRKKELKRYGMKLVTAGGDTGFLKEIHFSNLKYLTLFALEHGHRRWDPPHF